MAAWALVQIVAADLAQAPAILTTERVHRHGHQQVLSDNISQVQIMVAVDKQRRVILRGTEGKSRRDINRLQELLFEFERDGNDDGIQTAAARHAQACAPVKRQENAALGTDELERGNQGIDRIKPWVQPTHIVPEGNVDCAGAPGSHWLFEQLCDVVVDADSGRVVISSHRNRSRSVWL